MKKIFKSSVTLIMTLALLTITCVPVNASQEQDSTYENLTNEVSDLLNQSDCTETVVVVHESDILENMLQEHIFTRDDLDSRMAELSNTSEEELRMI